MGERKLMTQFQKEYIEAHIKTMTVKDIAEKLNIKAPTIRQYIKRKGIKANPLLAREQSTRTHRKTHPQGFNRTDFITGKKGVPIQGVSFDPHTDTFTAQISVKNRVVKLGRFLNLTDALNARIRGEKKYWQGHTLDRTKDWEIAKTLTLEDFKEQYRFHNQNKKR